MPGSASFRRTVEAHRDAVRALLAPLHERTHESVPLEDALNRVTSHAVTSPVALPLFRNSQMDGIAVRAAEAGPRRDHLNRQRTGRPGSRGRAR